MAIRPIVFCCLLFLNDGYKNGLKSYLLSSGEGNKWTDGGIIVVLLRFILYLIKNLSTITFGSISLPNASIENIFNKHEF